MGVNYVLAMYDVRGKQEFIFRKNQIKEIIGGSCIIRDCFKDYLYPAAREYRDQCGGIKSEEAIYQYPVDGEADDGFDTQKFKERMQGGIYLGEVVYEGGGNFLVLYRDEKTCIEINKIFTKKVMMETGTLKVLCTWIPVDESLSDYVEDRKKLYEKHRINEAQESVIRPVNTLPFVQIDSSTSQPLTSFVLMPDSEKEKVSKESFAKYQKYYQVAKQDEDKYGQKVLDKLVKKKGEDSLLAVIFIDGNNMGVKVQECLNDCKSKSYQICITALRKFSQSIQKDYIDDRMKDINTVLAKKYKVDDSHSEEKRRFVVYAGDEMNFICRAEDAMDIVKAYFENLPKGCSSCAGISIFHSHAPYAMAYQIAEECCESGKNRMKENQETTTCYVDYHYCQGGLGMELKDIRKREAGEIISKPWLIKDNAEHSVIDLKAYTTLEQVERVVGELNHLDSRTNVKELAESAMSSLADFDMEMSRIFAHQDKELQKKLSYTFTELSGEERRRLIYDIVIAYDIWFRVKKQEKKEETEDARG